MISLSFLIFEHLLFHKSLKNWKFVIEFFHQRIEEYFDLFHNTSFRTTGKEDAKLCKNIIFGILNIVKGLEFL